MERDDDRSRSAEHSRQSERAKELERSSQQRGSESHSEALPHGEPMEGVFASVKSHFKDVYDLGRPGDAPQKDEGLAEASKTTARLELERSTAEAREKMLSQKAEVVRSMDGWKPEVWERSTEAERWKTLEATEKAFATLEGRNALPVGPIEDRVIERLAAAEQLVHGFTKEDAAERAVEVQLNRKLVLEDHPDRAMRAYFHEEHHVEQLQALERPESRRDFLDRDVALWTASLRAEKAEQSKDLLAIGDASPQYRQFAHEVSAQYNETALYLRVMDDERR